MAMVHELTSRKNGRNKLGPINDCIKTGLEKADQKLGRVAPTTGGLIIDLPELLFSDVSVKALQLLLGHELKAEVGRLAGATGAMLTRTALAAVHGALGATPDVFPNPPVKLVFRISAFRHQILICGALRRIPHGYAISTAAARLPSFTPTDGWSGEDAHKQDRDGEVKPPAAEVGDKALRDKAFNVDSAPCPLKSGSEERIGD